MNPIQISFVVISGSQALLDTFIHKHQHFFDINEVEFIFVLAPELDLLVLEPFRSDRLRIHQDDSFLGLCTNRNQGLQLARAPRIMFLDDDNALPDLPKLLAHTKHDWVLLATRHVRSDGSGLQPTPQAISATSIGTGVEWNQMYCTQTLKDLGGWSIDFSLGTGHWACGEAFILMNQLYARGMRQHIADDVIIEHPAVDPDIHLSGSIPKYIGYRHALGAAVARSLRYRPFVFWAAFFSKGCIASPLRGLLNLVQGDLGNAIMRLTTPATMITGIVSYLWMQGTGQLNSQTKPHACSLNR